jgi:iron complex transport system ATP-binding protein
MVEVTYTTRDLGFAYGHAPVLTGLDLRFEPGLFHAVIGPNGSGKSTLLDLLAGHRRPGTGEVLINGSPVGSIAPSALARLTALVPQEMDFNFPFTVREAVLMGRHPHIPRFSRPTQADLDTVSAAMHATDVAHLAGRTLAELSGGERQRTVLARALAQATPGLLLDEPTSSMDIRHGLAVMSELRRLARQERRTVIAVLHDLNLAAAYCDRIVILDHGRTHSRGSAHDALTPEAIRDVFGVCANVTRRNETGTMVISYDPKDNS